MKMTLPPKARMRVAHPTWRFVGLDQVARGRTWSTHIVAVIDHPAELEEINNGYALIKQYKRLWTFDNMNESTMAYEAIAEWAQTEGWEAAAERAPVLGWQEMQLEHLLDLKIKAIAADIQLLVEHHNSVMVGQSVLSKALEKLVPNLPRF